MLVLSRRNDFRHCRRWSCDVLESFWELYVHYPIRPLVLWLHWDIGSQLYGLRDAPLALRSFVGRLDVWGIQPVQLSSFVCPHSSDRGVLVCPCGNDFLHCVQESCGVLLTS